MNGVGKGGWRGEGEGKGEGEGEEEEEGVFRAVSLESIGAKRVRSFLFFSFILICFFKFLSPLDSTK